MKKTNQCLLCGNKKTHFRFTSYNKHGRHDIDKDDVFEIFSCPKCDCLFIGNTKVSKKYYEKYYNLGYYESLSGEGSSIVNSLVNKLEQWSLEQKQKIIKQNLSGNKKKIDILDIGCGDGKFLESLDRNNFERFGLEINPEGIRSARKKGLKIYDTDLILADFKGQKFDVITLWQVVEHLEDPIVVLEKINRILKDEGIVIISTPNIASFGARIGKQNWFHLDSPRHLILFSKKTVDFLFSKTRFERKKVINEFYDFPLDLFWSVQKTWQRYFIYPLYLLWKIIKN